MWQNHRVPSLSPDEWFARGCLVAFFLYCAVGMLMVPVGIAYAVWRWVL